MKGEARKMKQGTKDRWLLASVLLVGLSVVTGCDGFFVPEPNHGGGSTGNYVYVANGLTNPGSVAGFSIGSGKLTAVSGSPLAVDYSPQALVVTPSNSFLYVAGPGAVYVYTINSDGSLSASSSGASVAIFNLASLAVSPDGQWLFGLDVKATQLVQFKINTSTGALTTQALTPYTLPNAAVAPSPKMVRVAPTGNYVFAAVGSGDIVFTLDTSTGAVAVSQVLTLNSAQTSDTALAIDSTAAHLYIARSGANGGLAVYTIGASGVLTEVSGSPFATGAQPFAVQIDNSGKYVYVANRQDATISGFSIGTNAALTALAGSPYVSGTGVISLAEDKTNTYILAGAFGGSPDLSMYSIDTASPGKLIQATTTATGTDPTGVTEIATTH
jgi:6-phosphogluconolactonase